MNYLPFYMNINQFIQGSVWVSFHNKNQKKPVAAKVSTKPRGYPYPIPHNVSECYPKMSGPVTSIPSLPNIKENQQTKPAH